MKIKNNKFKLFFVMLIVCFASIFTFKTLPNLKVSSFAFFQTQQNENIKYKDVVENLLTVEISSLETSFKETTTNTDITSTFEKTYTGEEFELSLTATSVDVTNFTYQWQYSEDGSDFSVLEGETNSSIKLKNCNQSGYYNCIVTNADDTTQVSTTQNINFVISQKEVVLENISLKSNTKVYDGTNLVELNATLSGIIDGDLVVAEVFGKTATANADLQKVVQFHSASLTGEDANNYVISSEVPQVQFVIDVTKCPVKVNWQTLDNKTSYVYNTKDQISNISASYNNIAGEKVQLAFTITGYNTFVTTKHYTNEFLNVGTYKAVAVSSDKESNYELTNVELSLTITRATPTITIANTVFTYTGVEQDASRCVTINNDEQELVFTNNYFTTVTEGNGKQVTVYALATENYNYASQTFVINVEKATIDTSKWSWYYPNDFTYTGTAQSVRIINHNPTLVTPFYTGATQTNVGTYTASVRFELHEPENYNAISFASLTWKIKKATVSKPNCQFRTTVYTGSEQTLDIPTNGKYEVINNTYTNAGVYYVGISLKDNANYQWEDGSVENLSVKWIIQKAEIVIPQVEKQYTYTGSNLGLGLEENDIYIVVGGSATEVGNYTTTLILKDPANYQWAGTESAVATINWQILEKQKNTALPIVAILISLITIVLIAVYATLHSTKVIKHRRKRQMAKQALEKQRKIDKQNEELKLKSEKLEVVKATVVSKENTKTLDKTQNKEEVKEQPKKDVKSTDKKEEKQEKVENIKETSKTSTTVAKTARKTRATTKKKKVVAKKRNDARKKATEIKRAAEKKVQTKQKAKAKKAKELEKAKIAKKQIQAKAKAKANAKKTTTKKTTAKTSVKSQTKK